MADMLIKFGVLMGFKNSLQETSKLIRYSVLGLSLITSSAMAHKHENSELGFETTKLSDGIYMISGVGGFTGGNIGLIVGDDGTVMIDNGVDKVTDLLKSEIAKTTSEPIEYIINTHLHGDHIGNNAYFGSNGAKIISHQNLRASLKKNKEKAAALPVMTFSDQMTLHINNDAAKIIHVKDAHTDGDAFIHFQEANIIHSGDLLFNKRFPFIDASNGGTLAGVLTGLKLIASLSDQDTQIIPGHGPLATKADVQQTIAMLEGSRELIAQLVNDGKSDDEILKADPLHKYQSYAWEFITMEKMIKQMIANTR